jgi:phage terminase small subunit
MPNKNPRQELTKHMEAFCQEYLIDMNATRAYLTAYGIKKAGTAATNGSMLLRKPKIAERLNELMNKKANKRIASQDEVLEFLTRTMRGELEQEQLVVEGQGEGISQARKVNVQVPAKDRNKAAELLGKRYGIFSEQVNLKVDSPKIIDDLGDKKT